MDATVSFDGAFDPIVFERFSGAPLVGPPLLWSETSAALRQVVFRGIVSVEDGRAALKRFLHAPIDRRSPRRLYETAWSLAEEFGWAKTYDAEYVALASLLGCRLLTKDARLARRVGHMVDVVGPADL